MRAILFLLAFVFIFSGYGSSEDHSDLRQGQTKDSGQVAQLEKQINDELSILRKEEAKKRASFESLFQDSQHSLKELWQDALNHPTDQERFDKWHRRAVSVSKQNEKKDLSESLKRSARDLLMTHQKIRKLEGELDDLHRLSPLPEGASQAIGTKDPQGIQEEMDSLRSQIEEADRSLANAQEWAEEYPNQGWDSQVVHWRETKKMLEEQLNLSSQRLRSEGFGSTTGGWPSEWPSSDFQNQPGSYSEVTAAVPTPRPSGEKPLPKDEKAEMEKWKQKGFSELEIKILKSGGRITDETGRIIIGWPPNKSKKSLTIFDKIFGKKNK